MPASPAEVAARFESLGGGSLHPGGWAFGCEFGYWQRSQGTEPLGLLRWASIGPEDLLKGLQTGFAGVEDETALLMREHTGPDWGYTQTTYGMFMDHSDMPRSEISVDVARRRIARSMGFLRDKLLADLASGEKLFVYRTHDHTLDDSMQTALADAVSHFGNGVLCYIQHATADHPAFTAVRKAPNLIVAYIDRFAPQEGQLVYNGPGWRAVCHAALGLWSPPTDPVTTPVEQPPQSPSAPAPASAMEYLARNPSTVTAATPVPPPQAPGILSRLRRWLRLR
jgi:hypothetical protein